MNHVGVLLRNIGRRIAELRRAAGLTQEDLAERLDVSAGYIRQVEGGGKNLSVRSLAAFADAVHGTVAALFEEPTAPVAERRSQRRAARPVSS